MSADPQAPAAEIARRIADDVQALSDATRDRRMTEPDGPYHVVAGLASAAVRLPEPLDHVADYIVELHNAGRLAADTGPFTASHLGDVRLRLADAAEKATALLAALERAAAVLGRVSYVLDTDDPRGR